MTASKRALAIILSASFTGLLGCSRPGGETTGSNTSAPNGSSLVGKWIAIDGQETIDFGSDSKFRGRLKYGSGQQPKNLTGSYFTEGNKIAFTVDQDHPMTWEFKMAGDEVIFTYASGGTVKMDGSMAKFKREK